MRFLRLFVALAAVIAFGAGCGQKWPLYLRDSPPPGVKPPKPRTEFIVIFFWREPTPSDQLMNLTTAPAGGGTTPTGAGP